MATRFHYKQIIIGRHYTEAMAECGQNRIFEKRDSPEKWGMSCFAPRVAEGVYDDGADNKTSFWNIGFVSDKFGELSLFPSMVGKNFAWCITPSPYWFCRTRKWMPYWGEATTQRADLMTDIRLYLNALPCNYHIRLAQVRQLRAYTATTSRIPPSNL